MKRTGLTTVFAVAVMVTLASSALGRQTDPNTVPMASSHSEPILLAQADTAPAAAPAAAEPAAPAAPEPATPTASEPAAAKTYVGNEACASCHGDEATALSHTQHGKAGFSDRSSHGCETCHGPGSAHVENPDDPTTIVRVTSLKPSQQTAICLGCHDHGAQSSWHGGQHEARGLTCTSCHSVHSFKSEKGQLQAKTTQDQCFSCHKDVRADLWKTSHHPVREGKMTCTDCHTPHGSNTEGQLIQASINDQCYSCHAEKRGPFIWDHPPVRENCLSCHTPHGSNHPKLEKTGVPMLCQECHSNTRHPGTMYDGTTVANGTRPSNRMFNRGCLNCHTSIHGSNHPSSPQLGH